MQSISNSEYTDKGISKRNPMPVKESNLCLGID